MPEIKKQLPAIDGTNRPFWEAARHHELVVCGCKNCNGLYFPPVTGCTNCDHPDMEWVRVSGKGEVFTFCVFRRAFHPAWRNDIPYNAGYVKLAEGPLLMTNFVEYSNDNLYIGMPVEVVFEDITDEITLPKFRPVK